MNNTSAYTNTTNTTGHVIRWKLYANNNARKCYYAQPTGRLTMKYRSSLRQFLHDPLKRSRCTVVLHTHVAGIECVSAA
ncbi:hypothetical protein ACH3XW_20650 [Acanthocheilonema viteae]